MLAARRSDGRREGGRGLFCAAQKCTIIPRSRVLAIIVPVIMPVPDDPVQPQKNVSQKQMTKAERRELQERQRAAKLAQKQQQAGKSEAGPVTPSPAKPTKAAPSGHKKTASGYDAATTGKQTVQQAEDPTSAKSRGIRIFSHFGLGLPKTLGQGVKGDVHPAIVRLALLFSEFKICGANARCIATLTAFKTVCAPYFFLVEMLITLGDTRLYDARV